MKTFKDCLEYLERMRKVLTSESTKQKVREIRSRFCGYEPSLDLPLYPTHDNQLLFTDINIEDFMGLMEKLGFKVTGEMTTKNSRWDWDTKGLFKNHDMMYEDRGISAVVGYDPAQINFTLLERETVKTEIELRVESPEVKFLPKKHLLDKESQLITSIPLSSFVTLHPSRATSQQCEDVVIGLLEQTIKRNANGFYGRYKEQAGVLNQIE